MYSEQKHMHTWSLKKRVNYVVVISRRSTVQVEEGGNSEELPLVILLQSNQLTLLLMQMFGLEAEGPLQCATLLW